MFYLKRQNKEYGPYESSQIISYYHEGDILDKDLLRHDSTDKFISVAEFIVFNNLRINPKREKLQDIILNLFKIIFLPFNFTGLIFSELKTNRTFLGILMIILIPVIGLLLIENPILIYGIFGFYFAVIWVLILYRTIGTDQTELNKVVIIFIGTIILSSIIIFSFHALTNIEASKMSLKAASFLASFCYMFLGVSLIEEFCKQILIYWVIVNSKFITVTRTAIFYGMVAGIAFGIFEGIEYQMGLNKTLDIDSNYFFNILRITSLPFFHAIWAGIGAYYISLSQLFLKFNYSLKIAGLILPSIFHALYNIFGISVAGIFILVLSAGILFLCITKSDQIGKILI